MACGCMQCPRKCGVERPAGVAPKRALCRAGGEAEVALVSLHRWEEPCISGTAGSGAVFFSGCNLKCIFCQNEKIRDGLVGKEITEERLSDIFLKLQDKGANNINLVTASHFTEQLVPVLQKAKQSGLHIPILWNSSGYELPETLRLLDGLIDIYLPDFKYLNAKTAAEYSSAPDYPETAKAALAEMVRQCGAPRLNPETGLMQRGVQVRHLVLPGHAQESRQVLWYLYQTYGNGIGYSIMNQYTPMPQMREHPLLSRRVTAQEYGHVVQYAQQIGIENAFTQEGESACESFIPEFSGQL